MQDLTIWPAVGQINHLERLKDVLTSKQSPLEKLEAMKLLGGSKFSNKQSSDPKKQTVDVFADLERELEEVGTFHV
jgi:hypothetical protein